MRFITLFMILTSTFSFAQEKTMTDTAPKIKFETTLGDFIIELDAEKAPISSANFVYYVESGFYDGTIFHRIIPGFMTQGGGFSTNFEQKSVQAPIQNEANNGLKNDRGTLSMARTNDPHSATAQFFINFSDNGSLNHRKETPAGWGYAVFGKVIEGMDVIDAMAGVVTGNRGVHQNVPQTDIVVNKSAVVK